MNPGVNLLANPFRCGSNTVGEVLGNVAPGTGILVWLNDATESVYDYYLGGYYESYAFDTGLYGIYKGAYYLPNLGGWRSSSAGSACPPPLLPPGHGFVYYNPSNYVISLAFVGSVVPGPGESCSVPVAGSPQFTLMGSLYPVTDVTSGLYNFPINGDSSDNVIYVWTGGVLSMDELWWTFFVYDYPYGWSDSIQIPLGMGYFFRSFIGDNSAAGAVCPYTWVQVSPEPARSGSLGIHLQRTANTSQLALQLSGTADTSYVILARTNILDAIRTVETVLTGYSSATELTTTIQKNGRTTAFLEAVEINTDSDADGLPDWWMWSRFGHATGLAADLSRATDDYNSDGTNNLDEFSAQMATIQFGVFFPEDYTRSSAAPGVITVTGGAPVEVATLTDSTNFASANWIPFSANVTANLGSTPGWHDVWVGARGLNPTAQPTWRKVRIKLDTAAPALTLTGTAPGTVPVPMIQLTGYSVEPLAALTYDVTNTTGGVSGQRSFVTHQHYDSAQGAFTTNFFQCYDVDLAPGENTITLRATDWAGNVAVVNYQYSFSTNGDNSAPVLTVTWPEDGQSVSGDTFTLRGTLDDANATVQCEVVNASGTTNTVEGLVERNGLAWVEHIPLSAGTNTLHLTATDPAGNVTATNLTVVQSAVVITIDSVPAAQLNQATVPVAGTINVSDHTVWVNGVKATLNGNNWTVEGVPVNPGGTAVFSVRAIPNTDNGGNGTPAPQGNPASTGKNDGEANIEKPSRWYVEIYHNKWDEEQVMYNSLDCFTDVGSLVWADGGATNWNAPGFTNRSVNHSTFALTLEADRTNTWPRTLWPISSDGWYESVDWFNYNPGDKHSWSGVADAAVIPLEHCDVAEEWFYDVYFRGHSKRTAQAVIKLATGGKALSKRASLFGTPATVQSVVGPMPSSRIVVGELGPLSADGRRYDTLPDNATYDITPRLTGTDGTNFYTFTVAPVKERLEVTAVTFAGDAATYPIKCDTNGLAYPGAHWGSNVVTHVVSNKPALYVSGSRVSASVSFAALGGGFNTNLVVRGVVSGGRTSFTLKGTNSAPGSTNWSVPAVIADTNLLADTVDFYNPMTVEWFYAVEGATSFLPAGVSTNQVYVSWKEPETADLFHTVVHVACSNAAGMTVESNIVAGVWEDFTDREIHRADGSGPLEYWGSFAKAHRYDGLCLSLGDLLKYSDGKCGAWASFLVGAWAVHGISSAVHTEIRTDYSLFLNMNGKELVINESLPGQGDTEPLKRFLNHGVVRYASAICDPSYGLRHQSELLWEDASVDYMIYQAFDPSGNPYDYWRADTKQVQETRFYP